VAIDGVYSPRELRTVLRHPRDLFEVGRQCVDAAWLGPLGRRRRDTSVVAAEIARQGVSIVPGAVSDDLISQARSDLDEFARQLPTLTGKQRLRSRSTGGSIEYEVHQRQSDQRILRSHDPLAVIPSYLRFLLLPELCSVAASYLGPRWGYQAMIATRTLAGSIDDRSGFSGWHHDARGRKLNVFLLLTDVEPGGTTTVLLRRSHRLLFAERRRMRNFFPEGEVAMVVDAYGFDEYEVAAPAGSLVFFDAHALHRGRRSPHMRDAFQVNLMTRREHWWPHEITRSGFETLEEPERDHLLRRSNLTVID